MTAGSSTDLPLAGRRVLVTRARSQAGALSQEFTALGATVIELPVIEIVPAPNQPIDEAVRHLADYDWLIFTSVNGVDAFFSRLNAVGVVPDDLEQVLVGAIGRATARRIQELGVGVDFVPERFVAESVVEGLVGLGIEGKRVLLPRADIARDTLPHGLTDAGADVDIVIAYRTRLPEQVDSAVIERICRGEVDVITFASPSTVRNLAALIGNTRPSVMIACIGPITAAAARESGFAVDIVAEEYSVPGLVKAVVAIAGAGERETISGD